MKRIFALVFAGLAALQATVNMALADNYPSKPIRLIVPFPAGGGADVLARTLAEAMHRSLGQPLIVDNRPGASTNIGAAALIQSKPDGYTLMHAESSALIFNEHLFSKLPYDPAKDFTYIAAIGRFPVALVVHPSFPATNLTDFVNYVRKNRGKVSYASAGNGTPHHLAMELFKQRAGLELVHVPYKGVAPAMQDLFGNHISVMMLGLGEGLPSMRSGKVRSLAITMSQRVAALPDLPTFAELGIAGVEAYGFHGFVGPAGMAAEVVTRLNREMNKAMQDSKVSKLFADFGMESAMGSPESFRLLARTDSERWGKIIKAAGISLD